MALSFPLSADQFFDLLSVSECTFSLDEAMQSSQTGGGEVISASVGSRLWMGQIALNRGYHAVVAQQNAILDMLREPGRSFFAYDFARQYPFADQGGYILGAATPTIASLPSNREIAIEGLPPGYLLSPGDRMSFEYGSNPTRHALHQVAVGGRSDASGNLTVEVSPGVRSGATAGAAITLIRPQIKAIIVPGSTQIGASGAGISEGASFSIVQTLR